MKRPKKGAPSRGDLFADRVRFDPKGLVPVVAQDEAGGVLMLAWANREAIVATFETGRGTYWSRSRGELWVKGDTSGHVQQALAVSLDCDGDAVLYIVRQTGPACHLGTRSCFAQREEITKWQTSGSSPSSGRRSSPARPRTTPRSRATPASSSRAPARSGRRSSRKPTR